MDEDESRLEARSSSYALSTNSIDQDNVPPQHDDSYLGNSSDAHVDADSMTEEQHLRAHFQDFESSFVPPISPIRVIGPEGGIDDTYMFDAGVAAKKPLPPSPSPSPSLRQDVEEAQPSSRNEDEQEHEHEQELEHTNYRRQSHQDTTDNTLGQEILSPSAADHPASRGSPQLEIVAAETEITAEALQSDKSGNADPSPAEDNKQGSKEDQEEDDHSRMPTDFEVPESTTPKSSINQRPQSTTSSFRVDGFHAGTDVDLVDTTASLENMSSSPTAAAAARTISRAISMASQDPSLTDDYSTSDVGPSLSRESSRLEIPPVEDDRFPTDAQTASEESSELDLEKPSLDAGNTPGNALRFSNRPKYLRSRNASQRSSTSSFLSNEDGHSDVTIGADADYAIQSGGAVPATSMQRSLSTNVLLRSISMGSMASGIDDFPDSNRSLEPLEPLEENETSPGRSFKMNGNEDNLTTPKPRKSNGLLAPTDTVIARHVRNVEVPESVAREYKTKGRLETPSTQFRKISNDHTPAPGTAAKNGRNLTLKEQSSTIERLSKENFDLKLKVMFLSDRLDKLSEEGIKEMISENVELKTSLAVIQRDNKILRKRVKELEKRMREDEDTRPSTARSGYSSDGQTGSAWDEEAQEREEELLYLRERVEEYITEIEHLKNENMAHEAEKRKMAEAVKTMGDRVSERVGDSLGRQEEADVFKDLLEQETARREQADDDNRRLRDEIFRLKQELNLAATTSGSAVSGGAGMHHTTNIYNITRKAKTGSPTRARPMSGLSGDLDQAGSMSQSSTLVEDLRRESEQLRHENAELRREVGAQTSMLTSRNREKERLYQEIEDLKLAHRRAGAPSTIDTLLDRSASRAGAHERSQSRGSARTRVTMAMDDAAREELENKLAEHRDKVSELKIQNQELQRELETCMEDFELAVEAKREAEESALALQDELDNAMADMMALQAERDEALQDHAQLESEFEVLRREAQEEIDTLESEADQRSDEIQRLQIDLQDRTDNFNALQEEMRKMSEALIRLEDDQEHKHRRIEELEAEQADNNKELEELEAKLIESNDKANRLGVQQESSQGEIAFLREEQEADKIRIGDLEAAFANAEQSLREERDRAKELDQRLAKERRQREIIATREKEDVQQFVNELNRDLSTHKDEARRLRKSLTSREVEAAEWKERLMELENNLREALGDLNGTRSSLLKSIAKLQRELEETVRELDTTKASLVEKDRLVKQRDALLESHGLESRKLAELLDKERLAHRNTKNSFETFQRTHSHVSRTVTSQDSRIIELETTRAADKKKLAQLEANFKDQLAERNNLLLILWTRLSVLCGSDWAHGNSLINGRALPSLEAVATMLPGFSKNLLAAVKTIESMLGGYQTRIKAVEKDLWKEYQTLEENLEVRTKKLDRLEAIVRHGVASGDFNTTAKINQLEAAVRALKIENATLMRANDAKTRAVGGYFDWQGGNKEDGDEYGSPSPNIPTGPIRKKHGDNETASERRVSMPRSKTSHLEAQPSSASASNKSRTNTMSRSSSIHTANTQMHPADLEKVASNSEADTKWMFRLRELEYKLKQEREARNMDRAAARQRIAEGERQKDELVAELVRFRRKGGE